MVFSSMTFLWVFLPLLLVFYYLAHPAMKNYVLLVFSLVFYAWGEPRYIFLMIISIVVNYAMGILLNSRTSKRARVLVLISAIIFNVGLLGYYKYSGFLVDNINKLFGTSIKAKALTLPIGISFYTFQIMSYIIDLYRKEIKVQKNVFNLALYISFFPQLIAGPIVKYKDVDEQIRKRNVTLDSFVAGTKRFIYGLSKKTLIANTMAIVADRVFDSDVSGISTSLAWVGAISYSLQIYYDFSGYSDMAIGLGKMFGFEFAENFNLPYKSKSITEFWRRWHISLSTWFKEYIYIPLGGNRKGKIRTYINLWIVFIVTGIWHGAAWTFLAWGLFHGFFIFVERLGLKKLLDKCHVINHVYALFVVNFGWVIFRSNGLKNSLRFIKRMIIPEDIKASINIYSLVSKKFIVVLIAAVLLSCIIQSVYGIVKNNGVVKKIVMVCEPLVIIALWLLCIMSLVSNTYNPFIYFRF